MEQVKRENLVRSRTVEAPRFFHVLELARTGNLFVRKYFHNLSLAK